MKVIEITKGLLRIRTQILLRRFLLRKFGWRRRLDQASIIQRTQHLLS